MARAPPSDDGEPAIIEFGIPVLDDQLEAADLTFPADRDELRTSVGELEVPYDASGHTLRVADALDELEAGRFETKTQLLDALHPVFEDRRQRATSGLLASLRSFLPF